MADVFLSYTSRDRAIADRVAESLERAGISVWRDVEIATGREYQREIDRLLNDAKLVVAIVTRASQDSRVLRQETMIAFEQEKLLPIVFDGAALPAPLDRLQVVNGDQRDWGAALQEAVRRRLLQRQGDLFEEATPHDSPSRPRAAPSPPAARRLGATALQALRTQTFYWLGVGGAVVTLAGNLDAFLVFSGWVEWLNLHWAAVITWFWNFVIPFDIEIIPEDAVIFTLLAVLFLNLLLTSSDADRNVVTTPIDIAVLAGGVALTAYIAFLGFVYELDANRFGLTDAAVAPVLNQLHGADLGEHFDAAASYLVATVGGMLSLALAYTPISLIFAIRPNTRAFGARLWRILLGVLLVALTNQVSLSLEAQDWAAALKTQYSK